MTIERKPQNLINLDLYPLTEPNSLLYRRLVKDIRRKLTDQGAVSLPQFLKADSIQAMADEANALAPLAYPGPTEATPYFFNYDITTNDDPDHPINRKSKRHLAQIAYDLIPPESLLYQLYHWDPLPAFLADVLGFPKLHQMTDLFQSLNISIMEKQGCQQWHFDKGHFVTTLLLQEPEAGGVFEYVPNIRDEDDEHFDEVQKVLGGDRENVKRIQIKAGMLNLFKGHYSLHHVTPVEGRRRRIQTALAYSAEPDRVGSLKSSILHYGPRVTIRVKPEL
ncbi:MAG: hypothetical protein ACI845_001931 [Gammaproteobacteria bacterium]|jgi:hypothetical protein